MKKLLSIAIAAAFAATSFSALAQDKKDVKSGGDVAKSGDKSQNVTTGGSKPKRDEKGGMHVKKPEHQGKRKTEEQRTEKK